MSKKNTPTPRSADAPEKEKKVAPILELKMLDGKTGGFAGIGSPFNEVDSYGDIVMPGAYKDAIADFLESGFNVDSHGWSYKDAVGFPTMAEEQPQGLYFEASFHGTDDAQAVRQKMRERKEAGKKVYYSIGYYVREAELVSADAVEERLADVLTAAQLEQAKMAAARRGRLRLLKGIDLAEISVVLRPAAMGAEATEVKSDVAAESKDAESADAGDNEEKDAGERQDGAPLQKRQDEAQAALSDVIERWSEIGELCLKEGRAISSARRKRLKGLRDHLAAGVEELDGLLEETEPKPKQQEPDEKSDDDNLWLERERARATRSRLVLQR